MRLLGRHFKQNLKEGILAPLFKMLEALFELLIPLIVARIIDYGIPAGDTAYILRNVALMVTLGLVGFASTLTAQYFAAKCATSTGASLRKELFAHLNSFSYKEIDSIGTSTMITRMTSDIEQIQRALNMFLRLFLRSPFIVFGAMICAFMIGHKTDLVFGITIAGLFAFVFIILFITMPLNSKVQLMLEKITRAVRENLSGVRVIRAFNRQEDEAEDFRKRSTDLFGRQMVQGAVSGLLNPLSYAAINMAIVAVIYVGSGEVFEGVITRGTVVALVNYMSQILVELIKLANLIILESRGLTSLKRVNELMDVTNSMPDGLRELKTGEALGIELNDVSFGYGEGAAPAVDHVSLSIRPGETVGIIGGTGSGKTTLVNLMARLYDVTDGEVRIGGAPAGQWKKDSLIRNIAVVPQKAALFSGNLAYNLRMADPDATEEECYKALDVAQALEFVEAKGEGLNLEIEEGGVNLSGGQKQRLTIARALVKKAGLLILDDSSSALDYATDAALRSALRKREKECTTVIVSQRISSVRDADRIVVMEDGRAVGIGTHEELLRSCPVYREICETQLTEEEAGL